MSIAELTRDQDIKPGPPRTFEDMKKLSLFCRRCGEPASHTISLSAASMGKGRGSLVAQVQRTPVCEKCAVEIFMVVRRALKL